MSFKRGCIWLLSNHHQVSQSVFLILSAIQTLKLFKCNEVHLSTLPQLSPAPPTAHAPVLSCCSPTQLQPWLGHPKEKDPLCFLSCLANTTTACEGGPLGFMNENVLDMKHLPLTISKTRLTN